MNTDTWKNIYYSENDNEILPHICEYSLLHERQKLFLRGSREKKDKEERKGKEGKKTIGH